MPTELLDRTTQRTSIDEDQVAIRAFAIDADRTDIPRTRPQDYLGPARDPSWAVDPQSLADAIERILGLLDSRRARTTFTGAFVPSPRSLGWALVQRLSSQPAQPHIDLTREDEDAWLGEAPDPAVWENLSKSRWS
jgi:hypothetical protein